MGLSFTQQEIHRTNDFDAVLILGEVAFHRNDDLLVIVRGLAQGDRSRSLVSGAFMDSVTWMYFFSSVLVAMKSTSSLSSLPIKYKPEKISNLLHECDKLRKIRHLSHESNSRGIGPLSTS